MDLKTLTRQHEAFAAREARKAERAAAKAAAKAEKAANEAARRAGLAAAKAEREGLRRQRRLVREETWRKVREHRDRLADRRQQRMLEDADTEYSGGGL
jgi:hypothetical protein